MKQTRFAIIGGGGIAKIHAHEIGQIEGAELAAVAGNGKNGSKIEHVPYYEDYRELLKRDDIDIVNICTPSGLHAEITVEAAKAGKHVIVEKPMDVTLDKADAMIQACKAAGVKLAVISQHRFDRSTVKVKQDIAAGKLGNLILGQAAVNWYRSQAYYDSSQWRGTWSLDGGGALMNQSIHTIDVLQYLMGPAESVHAYAGTYAHERIEVEDAAAATVKFKNGAIGTIVGTTAAYPGLSAKVELFGTKGTAIIENDNLTHLYYREEGAGSEAANMATSDGAVTGSGASDPLAISGIAHRTQFIDMIEAISEDREPMINGAEGRRALELILAIYKSAKTGLPVSLPLT